MGQVTATATATIPATTDEVLAFLRDYSQRPRILTENYSDFRVEDGVLAFHFSAGGRERDYRLVSSESNGVLLEKDELSSFLNSWRVEAAGDATEVTLNGTWQGAGGIAGVFEGLFAPMGLKRIYAQVLTNLEGVFRK